MRTQLIIPLLIALLSLSGCNLPIDAIQAYGNKDYIESRALTESMLESLPDDPILLTLHAWSQFKLGYLDKAMAEFKHLQESYPDNFDGYMGETWVLLKRGRYDEAEKSLELADRWRGFHQFTLSYATHGWLAFYRGDLDAAEQNFARAEEELIHEDHQYYFIDYTIRRDWSTLPWVGFGWLERARNRPDAARAAFEKGLERDERCNLCYAGLAQLALDRGQTRKAIKLAFEGLKVTRHDPDLVVFLNRLLLQQKSKTLGLRLYQDLADASNGDPLYLANLGYARFYRNDLRGAYKAFTKALKTDPELPLARIGAAQVRCKVGKGKKNDDCGRFASL